MFRRNKNDAYRLDYNKLVVFRFSFQNPYRYVDVNNLQNTATNAGAHDNYNNRKITRSMKHSQERKFDISIFFDKYSSR